MSALDKKDLLSRVIYNFLFTNPRSTFDQIKKFIDEYPDVIWDQRTFDGMSENGKNAAKYERPAYDLDNTNLKPAIKENDDKTYSVIDVNNGRYLSVHR
ncbi:hypothetical protein PAF15_01510 [Weissella koreensis]|uniref:hypothetical protein n=1 Tax=Weissella koreensis TaxID=165096 RepID=UPI0022BA428E|nr:hypothetical protein [Weissella koreensis]MCZ9310654.1 hypothetical protein [Weissella koreensis]